MTLLAVDAGQTGSRARLVTADGSRQAEAGGVVLMTDAASVDRTVTVVGGLWRELGAERCDTVVVGTTGFARTPEPNSLLADRVAALTGAGRVVVAGDAVTAHAGALAGRPGVVAAVGTGVVVRARGVDGSVRTLDGYGSLFGDRGGGYGIGLAGLRFAARCHDLGDRDQPLLAAALAFLGPVDLWSSRVHGTAAVPRVASFATEVLRLAARGDRGALDIRGDAARELADTVAAAVARLPGEDVEVSWTGAVLTDDGLRADVLSRLAATSPRARPTPPHGDALDGAVLLAADENVTRTGGQESLYGGQSPQSGANGGSM